MQKQKIGKAKRQWKDEETKRLHLMDKWIKKCKPLQKGNIIKEAEKKPEK